MNWRFYLDTEEIDEPQGFSEIAFNIMRDTTWHGIMFEASTSSLRFYGEAFDYLKTAKEIYGVDAVVIFKAESRCEGATTYEEVINGKLNFAGYRETCGAECYIQMAVEQDNCAMTLKNRFEQKVALDDTLAFDKQTVLPDYPGLSFTMELATQNVPVSVEGYVAEGGDVVDLSIFLNYGGDPAVRPTYGRVVDESLQISQLLPNVFASSDNFANDPILSPALLLDDAQLVNCFDEDFEYTSRLKGSFDFNFVNANGSPNPGTTFFFFKAVLGKGEWNESPPPDPQTGDWDKGLTILASGNVNPTVSGDHWSGNFDFTFSGTTDLAPGRGIYPYLCWEAIGGLTDIRMVGAITFDPETHFIVKNSKVCPPTDAEVYLVNETLARVTEAITDRCLTVKSDYYGRTDSAPYASTNDGCGALRVLTNGLRIRQAENKEFFISLKDLLEGLNAIDNLGFTIEGDNLRIEPAEYFYKESLIMNIPLVPRIEAAIEQDLIKTLIKVGYKKWEINSVKGLDEFNSNKEFGTSVKSVNNPLDITSSLVASGYVIDQLRTSSLAATGQADSSYDNDTFIICVARSGYGFHVEQGAVTSASGLFSPATAYNWRIRPFYNLMRWAKSIFPGYPNIVNGAYRLFFRSGTGNYLAKGEQTGDCKMDKGPKAENQDLSATDFFRVADGTPIWKPEQIAFEYPLSIAEYKTIKSNPLGYFSVQCGQGEFIKAYISSIEYKPAEGKADFNLLLKWQ